jgi:DNA-binding response OmpR family regulator
VQILIVGDEKRFSLALKQGLEEEGYVAEGVS